MTSFDGLTVLFLGDLNHDSNSYSRLKAFRALGARVLDYSHTPVCEEDGTRIAPTFNFRIAWKLGFHLDAEKANQWLLQTALRETPALIWIEKGNMIKPCVLRQLRTHCPEAIFASDTDDDMHRWSNRTWAYTHGLRHYDFVFTT